MRKKLRKGCKVSRITRKTKKDVTLFCAHTHHELPGSEATHHRRFLSLVIVIVITTTMKSMNERKKEKKENNEKEEEEVESLPNIVNAVGSGSFPSSHPCFLSLVTCCCYFDT